jgi:hypothetical protein
VLLLLWKLHILPQNLFFAVIRHIGFDGDGKRDGDGKWDGHSHWDGFFPWKKMTFALLALCFFLLEF